MERKKKVVILITFGALFLISLGLGVYFLLKKVSDIITLDKYPDTAIWCNNNVEDKTLNINCKALLLNIRNLEGNISCFDVQIISRDNELKDISVCEKLDSLTYTNEVLQYKKLMPVNMVFSYTKDGFSNNFLFTKAMFSGIDDIYIQEAINQDISRLVTLDTSSTTILNSVDFCPNPDILPDYITDENKLKYNNFFNQNILQIDQYNNKGLYSVEDSKIALLFTCESKSNRESIEQCSQLNLLNSEITDSLNTTSPLLPIFETTLNEENSMMLKQISYIQDNTGDLLLPYATYIAAEDTITKPMSIQGILKNFIQKLGTNQNISEEVYCAMYSLLSNIKDQDGAIASYQDKMRNILNSNISQLHSVECLNIIGNEESVSKQGLYLKSIYSKQDSNMNIYSHCSNLQRYIK